MAYRLLEEIERNAPRIHGTDIDGRYISFPLEGMGPPTEGAICLDGDFSANELEALALYVRRNTKPAGDD